MLWMGEFGEWERGRVVLIYTQQAAGGQLPAQLPALRGLCGVESFVPSSSLNRPNCPWLYPLRVTRPFLEPSTEGPASPCPERPEMQAHGNPESVRAAFQQGPLSPPPTGLIGQEVTQAPPLPRCLARFVREAHPVNSVSHRAATEIASPVPSQDAGGATGSAGNSSLKVYYWKPRKSSIAQHLPLVAPDNPRRADIN